MSFGSIFQEITSAVYWTEYNKQVMNWFGITILAGLMIYDKRVLIGWKELTLPDLFTLKMEANCDMYISF